MPCYLVEGQRRGVGLHVNYLAVRHKPQLDKRLEAVAYTQHQTVTLLQKLVYSVLELWIAQERNDELRASLRLVTAAETARQHDYLRLLYLAFHSVHRLSYSVHIQISYNQRVYLCACALKYSRRVVFAVRAGEYRYKHPRLSRLDSRGELFLAVVCELLWLEIRLLNVNRINRLQLGRPLFVQVFKLDSVLVAHNLVIARCYADNALVSFNAFFKLDNKCAVASPVKLVSRYLACELETYAVAECHLCDSLRNSAVRNSPAGEHLALINKRLDLFEHRLERVKVDKLVLIVFRLDKYYL